MKVKVRCIKPYMDLELGVRVTPNNKDKNYERIVNKDRADVLIRAGVCKIIKIIKEEEIETTKLNVESEKAFIKRTPRRKNNK